ncbi:hypothetical protein I316_00147 [Kwoniella heveanensis BCC8398]|uniref:WSC domain-containing protein n=1 Tax=Kwoniella heveanensis BCC8398 TaxID=1296120 RepID=A0A1B9H3S1_9TREE|nr:hypothetical protein I316_00147 [Kwoniella heveanensis BCC8398]
MKTTMIHLFTLLATMISLGITHANPLNVRAGLQPRQYSNSADNSTLTSVSSATATTTHSVGGSESSSTSASASASTSSTAQDQQQQQEQPPSNVTAVQPNRLGWYPYGCYTDCANGDQANRGLPVWVYTDASNGPEKCIQACAEKGYAIAGLQFHEQCWCGNSLGGEPTSDEECKYNCEDDQYACGGDCRQNVWSYDPPGTADSWI